MKVNVSCPAAALSLSLDSGANNEFLTEMVISDMMIDIDRFITGKNKFFISSSSLFLLDEAEGEGISSVVFGPLQSGNQIKTTPEFYEFSEKSDLVMKIRKGQQ